MRDLASFLTAPFPPSARRGAWTTRFTDASNNNGPVNWRNVAHDSRVTGITGTELKATEGADFADPYFHEWRAECAKYGLRVMPYHFARPDQNRPEVEAAHFCSVVGKLHPWEWRPMLDFETAPFERWWAVAWAHEVRRRLGVAPMLYSYYAALVGMQLRGPILDGLVIAYPNGVPGVAPVPKPWRRWSAHQFSWSGHVAGFSGAVDLNYTPTARSLLAYPVKGLAWEPVMRRRRA